MKTFALGVLLSLALGAQGFAIIRPPYPAKPMPPYHGHFSRKSAPGGLSLSGQIPSRQFWPKTPRP